MRKLILTTATALMLATSATAGTVACDPSEFYHPTVTDGNGKTYQATYFNNLTCTDGEIDQRADNLNLDDDGNETIGKDREVALK